MCFAYTQSADLELASADLQHAKPVANTPIFSDNPNSLQESSWTVTYKLDRGLVAAIQDIFFSEIASIKDVAGIVPAATLQVIQGQLATMSENGGNPLGLPTGGGPCLLLSPNVMRANAADDARVLGAYSRTVKCSDAEARRRVLHEDYLYMDYAS